MATQTVDSLLLQTQVDDTGLTEQTNREIAQIERIAATVERVAAQLKPIVIGADSSQLRASLEAATGSVQDFFAGFPREGLPPLTWDIKPFLASLDTATARLEQIQAQSLQLPASSAIAVAPPQTPTLDIRPALADADRLQARIVELIELLRVGLPSLSWDIQPFLSAADQAVVRLAEVRQLAEITVRPTALIQAPTLAPAVLTLDTTEAVAAADVLAVRIQAIVERAATGLPPLGWDVAPFQRAAELVLLQLGQVEERAASLRLTPPSLAITQSTTPLVDTGPAETGVERLAARLDSVLALARAGLPPLGWDITPFETAATAVLARLESIRQSTAELSTVGTVPAQIRPIVTEGPGTGLTEIEAQLRRVADASEALNGFIGGMAQEFLTLTTNAGAAERALQGVGQTDLSVLMTLLQGINAELVATGHPGFLEGLIPELTTIRGEFAATSVEAKQLQTIINALSQARLPALTAGGGGPPPLPPVDQFAAFRRETVATNATVAELTATMARGNKGNLDYAVGLSEVEAQLRITNVELAESARRTAQYAEAGRQASLTPFNRGLENVRLTGIGAREELERGVPAFETHAQGAHRAAQALGVLAAQSVGVEGPIGRIAENLLLFSGGIGVVATVAGSVLALVKAVEFLSTAEREANDARDKAVQGLLQEAEQAVPRAVRAHEALTAAIEAQRRAREGLTAATVLRVTGDIGIVVNDPLATALALRAELNRRANKEELDGKRAVAQARADEVRVEIESLTAVHQAEIGTSLQRERAVALLKELQSQVHALIVPEERRLEIAKQITGLQQGLNLGVAARLAAEGQAIQSENALRQQAVQADEQNLRAQFAQEAIIRETSLAGELTAREQFFAQRRQLILTAARADESALRQRIGVAEQQPITDTSSQIARDAEITALRSQLQLREQIKQAQLDQLRNEERLAELAPLEKVGTPTPPVELTQRLQLRTVGTEELKAELQTEIGAAIRGIRDDATQISFEQATESAKQAAVAAARLDSAIHSIAGAAGGLIQVASGLFGIGHAAQAALGDVLGLVSGLGDVGKANADISAAREALKAAQATGDVAGAAAAAQAGAAASAEKVASVIGVVGAGLGLVGNLLSIGAALDAEHNRLVLDNSTRLAELSLRLDRSFQGSAGVQKAAGLTADVSSAVSQVTNASSLGFLGTRDAFESAVKATGLSIAEFDKIIRDTTGIEILDSRGRVVAATLAQADAAFKKIIETITQLSSDPAALRAQGETLDKLGISGRSTDPQVAALQRERDVQLQALNLSAQEEARIRALDLSTAKGRAAFLAEEQDLARRAQEKGISAAELGSFANVDELFQALGLGADAVNAFADAIHAVTDQTANIPRSFKQFAASSAAEIAGLGPNVPQPPEPRRLRGTDLNIPVNLERIGDGASLPDLIAILRSADLPALAQGIKAAKEKPAVITGNTIPVTIPGFNGDIRELAREVVRQIKELGSSDHSANSNPWDLG